MYKGRPSAKQNDCPGEGQRMSCLNFMRAYGKYFKNALTFMEQVCMHVTFFVLNKYFELCCLFFVAELVREGSDGASIS